MLKTVIYGFFSKKADNSESDTIPFFSNINISGSRVLGIIWITEGYGKIFLKKNQFSKRKMRKKKRHFLSILLKISKETHKIQAMARKL